MHWLSGATVRRVGTGVGLMLLGIVFGVLGVNITYQLATLVGVAETDYGQWITGYGLQYGLLVLAVAYTRYRGATDQFIQIKRVTFEGAVWIVLAPFLLIGMSIGFDPALAAIGIEMSAVDPTTDPTETVTQSVVFFAAAWLVAAPSEELLFRGVIQSQLRETLGPIPAVIIAATIFALMHVFIGILEGRPIPRIVGWGVETLAAGLIFGAAYERTDNLVIPSVIHATSWTLPYYITL